MINMTRAKGRLFYNVLISKVGAKVKTFEPVMDTSEKITNNSVSKREPI